MKTLRILSVLFCCASAAMTLQGAERPTLDPQLEPFRPLLEKTWKGALASSQLGGVGLRLCLR